MEIKNLSFNEIHVGMKVRLISPKNFYNNCLVTICWVNTSTLIPVNNNIFYKEFHISQLFNPKYYWFDGEIINLEDIISVEFVENPKYPYPSDSFLRIKTKTSTKCYVKESYSSTLKDALLSAWEPYRIKNNLKSEDNKNYIVCGHHPRFGRILSHEMTLDSAKKYCENTLKGSNLSCDIYKKVLKCVQETQTKFIDVENNS